MEKQNCALNLAIRSLNNVIGAIQVHREGGNFIKDSKMDNETMTWQQTTFWRHALWWGESRKTNEEKQNIEDFDSVHFPCYRGNRVEPRVGDMELSIHCVPVVEKQSKFYLSLSKKNLGWCDSTAYHQGIGGGMPWLKAQACWAVWTMKLDSWLHDSWVLKIQGKSQRAKGTNEPVPKGANPGLHFPLKQTNRTTGPGPKSLEHSIILFCK